MRLIALLSARAPAAGAPAGVATTDEIRIGVHSPVEHQARQLLAAGVDQLILRSDAPTSQLARVADTLSRESGATVLLVTDGPDLARRIEKDDQILMVAEQMIVPQHALEDLIAVPAPALLVTPTETATAHFERIDGRYVWAGAALLSGETVLATIDMLGEWDLELTLLRRAVQQEARRIELSPDLATTGGLTRIADQEDAQRAMDALTQSGFADEAPRDALSALLAPVGRHLVALLARYQVNPTQLNWGSGMLAILAIAAASADWPRLAILVALLAEAAFSLGAGCARVMLRLSAPFWLRVLVKGAGIAALAIIGGRLTQGNGLALLGVGLPLGLIAIQSMVDARDQRPVLGRSGLWKRLSTNMALTIALGGALGGRVSDAFVLIGLCAFGTVAARLLAAGDNRI